jgi:hypothetical protein
MDAQTVAAVAVASVALATFAFAAWQYYRQRRDNWLGSIIDGTKESAAVAAMRIRKRTMSPHRIGATRWRRRHHQEEIDALCLAAIFESSGRARALIHDSLRQVAKDERLRSGLFLFVNDLTASVARAGGYTDLSNAAVRVDALRGALGMDGPPRRRVTAQDLLVPSAWPCTCAINVHALASLEASLERLRQLVLICPHEGPAPRTPSRYARGWPRTPVVALDFHSPPRKQSDPKGRRDRTAKEPHRTRENPRSSTEKRQSTSGKRRSSREKQRRNKEAPGHAERTASDLVRAAKYQIGTDRDLTSALAAKLLGHRLRLVCEHAPAFTAATALASVPSRHQLSDELRKEIAIPPVQVVTLTPPGSGRVSFWPFQDVRGKTVILVDDVYRTGRTFDSAAASLYAAGAKQVLGLVATCTFTATRERCDLDEVDEPVLRRVGSGEAE